MPWWLIKLLIRLKFPHVQSLSVDTLANWLQQSDHSPTYQSAEKPLLLDAREPAEYQVSHLPNAQLAPVNPADLSALRSQPIVVYCSVGYRSARYANQLRQIGFQQVFNLEGSIFEWANMGYPVYRGGEIVQQVHPYSSDWGKLLHPEYRYSLDADLDSNSSFSER